MSSLAVVDAHALIWFLQDDPRLGAAARSVLEDPAARLVLPAIALAECCLAVEKGRTNIPSIDDLLQALKDDKRVSIIAVTKSDALVAVRLAQLSDLHDRLIVAVVMRYRKAALDAVLLTADSEVHASNLVPVVWE